MTELPCKRHAPSQCAGQHLGRLVLFHGIGQGDKDNLDVLVDPLRKAGFEVIQGDYGHIGPFGARVFTDNIAKIFARHVIQPGDKVLAHSNGAAVASLACDYGAQPDHVVYFGAALGRDTVMAPQVRAWDNHYCRGDRALCIGRLLIAHHFGDMGRVGYTGPPDPRLQQWDWTTGLKGGELLSGKHSAYVNDFNRAKFLETIIRGFKR